MSDNYLHVIPVDPTWQPEQPAALAAESLLRRMAPGAGAVSATRYDDVVFIDQGATLEEIRCPHCDRQLSNDWWSEAMDQAHASGFRLLAVVTPCCRQETTLNDLDYRWPAGFARFGLEAENPDRGWLTEEELSGLEETLGVRLRQVMAHY